MTNEEFEKNDTPSSSDAGGPPPIDDVIEDIVDALADEHVAEVDTESGQEQIEEQVEEIVEALTIEQQLSQARDNNMRLLAEIDNLRKRSQREMQQQLKYAALPVISEMLSVIDDLHRTLEASQSGGDVDAFTGGVEIVVQSFTTVLEKYECRVIQAEAGEGFDVKLHEAISMQPSDEFDTNVILAVVQQGYQMHDRVIRPSQVVVSSGPAAAEAASSE
ncbi:MAG: nucleotide exchange factor GrpE [Planctomycetaceae bacterium]|jgi:molecular chaperone GrpE|nr:nucleotide exchange factor GrpE [Planctomycetaceae bacterium]